MINALSYIGFTSPQAEAWKHFAPDILGMEVLSSAAGETVKLRYDDASWRIAIRPAEENDVEYLGWSVADKADLIAEKQSLAAAGFVLHDGDTALAAERGVSELIWFIDAFGFRHELSYDQNTGDTPFRAGHGISGFVTGECGLGHAVLIVPDLEAATNFYRDLLGFRHADDIEQGILIRFFYCNPRHHTLAITEVPNMRGLHHIMVEVEDANDVGRAWDRVVETELPIAMSLGHHPNDEMTSFYVRTPSGFELEFGAGGRLMDMSKYTPPAKFDHMSVWGHKPPAEPLVPGIIKPMETIS